MNPYEVLGVNENATDAEVRKAYLDLVKKYHPDKYRDNPLHELATQKLQEVNEAYDTINKRRESSKVNSDYSSASGERRAYTGERSREFLEVERFIAQGNYDAAKQALNAISLHNARWYYLYGTVYFYEQWHDMALKYYATACRMEPDNAEYRRAYATCADTGTVSSDYRNNGRSSGCSACDVCTALLCADCCCECMGGDLISCC